MNMVAINQKGPLGNTRMNVSKARLVIAFDRTMFGKLLNSYKDPDNLGRRRRETGDFIKAFRLDLKRLYNKYPELRPVKAKQLDLFRKGRIS